MAIAIASFLPVPATAFAAVGRGCGMNLDRRAPTQAPVTPPSPDAGLDPTPAAWPVDPPEPTPSATPGAASSPAPTATPATTPATTATPPSPGASATPLK